VRVAPYKIRKVGVVSTLLPGLADKVIDKTLRVTASGSRRRARPSSPSAACRTSRPRSPWRSTRCSAQGAELVIVFGASAIADRRDVIPAAIEAVGGRIEHFGMPVDPGNLMLIGGIRGRPVLGAPGCARSPKENGFDWVLMRLLAGLPVTRRT
jgi:molybdenum cofactor cytidylyltransferase